MPDYLVGFDGSWQEWFDEIADALSWAEEVGDTGRLVFVVRDGVLSKRLVAVFPAEREEEGKRLWQAQADATAAAAYPGPSPM